MSNTKSEKRDEKLRKRKIKEKRGGTLSSQVLKTQVNKHYAKEKK